MEEIKLNEEEYETVLRYMEMTDSTDFESARSYLARHDFDLQKALDQELQLPQEKIASIKKPLFEKKVPSSNIHAIELTENEAQQLKQHLNQLQVQKKQSQMAKASCWGTIRFGIIKFCQNTKQSKCSLTLKRLKKQAFLKYREKGIVTFQKLYQKELIEGAPIKLYQPYELEQVEQQMSRLLQKKNICPYIKPFLLIVSQNHNETVSQALRAKLKIQQHFYVIGQSTQQMQLYADRTLATVWESIKSQNADARTFTCVFHRNIYDKVEIIHYKNIESSEHLMRDLEVEIILQSFQAKINKYIALKSIHHHVKTQKNVNLESLYESFVDEQEEEQEDQQPTLQIQNKSIIEEQNRSYKSIIEEITERKKSVDTQKQCWEKTVEERKLRKMSIPEQPEEGKYVELKFRCPNGNLITRRFLEDEFLELIFNWVETEDQIQFENEKERQFDILTSYPPMSLKERQEETLGEVFPEGSANVIIREM